MSVDGYSQQEERIERAQRVAHDARLAYQPTWLGECQSCGRPLSDPFETISCYGEGVCSDCAASLIAAPHAREGLRVTGPPVEVTVITWRSPARLDDALDFHDPGLYPGGAGAC